jgi:hypothetical protein
LEIKLIKVGRSKLQRKSGEVLIIESVLWYIIMRQTLLTYTAGTVGLRGEEALCGNDAGGPTSWDQVAVVGGGEGDERSRRFCPVMGEPLAGVVGSELPEVEGVPKKEGALGDSSGAAYPDWTVDDVYNTSG